MASISRDFLADNKPSSQGFFSLLSLICVQPRKFFRIMDKTPSKYGILTAILILILLSFSAIQQADLSMNYQESTWEEDYLPEDEMLSTEFPGTHDPTQSWMTGFSAFGKQAIFWIVLAIVLSEVSLFNGKAPRFGQNLQIAVWSSLPFAIMAALQILFVMGGGIITEPGFAGFLDEWQNYHDLAPYLQSAVYALAAQFTFFTLWNFVLLYKASRETLRGKRIVVGFVLISWFLIRTLALGFEHYHNGDSGINTKPSEFSDDYESLPHEESWIEPLYPEDEGDIYGEDYP